VKKECNETRHDNQLLLCISRVSYTRDTLHVTYDTSFDVNIISRSPASDCYRRRIMIAEESRKSAEAPTAQLGRTAELGVVRMVGDRLLMVIDVPTVID